MAVPTSRTTFNDKAILRAVDKAMKPTLMGAGRYTMNIVRASLKQRRDPNRNAPAGHQPFSHSNAFSSGFKRTVVYALEEDGKAVLVGPQLVRPGMSVIAKSHEFGGKRNVKRPWEYGLRRKNIKSGAVAPVTLTSQHVAKTKDTIVRSESKVDPETGRKVVWIKLRTKSQVEHSKRLLDRMQKEYFTISMQNYPPRPYMRPGLIYATPKLTEFWKNAVKP